MTLSELLEELRLSRTRTQNGWVVHSHKPGDVLVRFHEDQSTVCVLSVKGQSQRLNPCGVIQIRIDERDYLMARAGFEFDVEIFGKMAMRGCYFDPGSLAWIGPCRYHVEFAYSRLEYMEKKELVCAAEGGGEGGKE